MAAMNPAKLDHKHCYAALKARDSRFDGVFYVGVSSTQIYCRPVCRVKLPKAEHCRFFRYHSQAEAEGFRPCLRCRPELAPENNPSSEDARKQLAQHAALRIREGALNELSMAELASECEIGERQLRRAIVAEYGCTPSQLAQTQRLLLAKQLLADSQLKIVDIAFAAGFASVRRFNEAIKQHYRLTPSDIRRQRKQGTGDEHIHLRLGYRPPFAWGALIQFLSSRSHPSLVQVEDERYWQTLSVDGESGWIKVEHEAQHNRLHVVMAANLIHKIHRATALVRQLFDLNANPTLIDEHLGQFELFKASVVNQPGLRIPGSTNIFELALRAVLGQQISVKAATTIFGRFVERFGEAVETPRTTLNRLSPKAETIANARLQTLIDLGLTERRASTIKQLAQFLKTAPNTHQHFFQQSRHHFKQALADIPGIGPWTVEYIAMRGLNEPDALPYSDLALMKAVGADKPKAMLAAAENWQPWRAYAAMRLWQQLSAGG